MAFAKSAKRGLALLGSAAMMVGFAAPTFAAPAQTADASNNTYYLQVDANLLKQIKGEAGTNEMYGPTKITAAQIQAVTGKAPADQTVLDLLIAVCGDTNVEYSVSPWDSSSHFLSGFNYDSSSFYQPDSITYSEYVAKGHQANQLIFDNNVNPSVAGTLSTAEYAGTAGWMFSVNNNSAPSAAPYYYGVDDKLTDTTLGYGDQAVVRFEYSLSGGADIGLSDSYIPTSLNPDGSFNWNTTEVKTAESRTDLTASIRANATPFVAPTAQ